MGDPVDLNELRVDAEAIGSHSWQALLDAYRITREALGKRSHDYNCTATWAYIKNPYPCNCGLDTAIAAADALVTPEGNTDD